MKRVNIDYVKGISNSQKYVFFILRFKKGEEVIDGYAVVHLNHSKVFFDWEKSIYLSQKELNKIKEKLLRECKDMKKSTIAIKTGISI